MTTMEYRRLGRAGIKVSVLSFGSWVTFKNQVDVELATECMQVAREHGVNFFDNAEAYAGGASEEIMGDALQQLGWDRRTYLVTSKFFWGTTDADDPTVATNTRNTLNRKYLLEAVDLSLERWKLDHLDVVYAHRPDPETPLEETVRAFNDVIDHRKAHYWGTSEWAADEIRGAHEIAQRYGWHAPVTEQPQYNLVHRERFEEEYARVFDELGYGSTTWSPLASGLLTGKYVDGIPEGSRASVMEWLEDSLTDEEANEQVRRFSQIADELECTPAQLAIAWCAKNPNVSTVITGASKPEQVTENMRALDVMEAITPEVKARVEDVFAG
jgi:voltage-dependent potassium channel beta subunit